MSERLDPTLLSFRPLHVDDLPLMHRWLNTGFVKQWYNEAWPLDEVEEKYGSRLRGEDSTYSFVIMYGDTPIQ